MNNQPGDHEHDQLYCTCQNSDEHVSQDSMRHDVGSRAGRSPKNDNLFCPHLTTYAPKINK